MEAVAMARSHHPREPLLLGVLSWKLSLPCAHLLVFAGHWSPHMPSPREGGRSGNDPTLHG